MVRGAPQMRTDPGADWVDIEAVREAAVRERPCPVCAAPADRPCTEWREAAGQRGAQNRLCSYAHTGRYTLAVTHHAVPALPGRTVPTFADVDAWPTRTVAP